MSNNANLRIFFGLQIDAIHNQTLAKMILDRFPKINELVNWTIDENCHLTLHFIAKFPEEKLNELIQSVTTLTLPKVQLSLLQLSEFPLPHGHCLAARARLNKELAELFHSLSQIMNKLEIPLEIRSFKPHITLAKKKNRHSESAIVPITINNYTIAIDQLILYQSLQTEHGSLYKPLAQFPLG